MSRNSRNSVGKKENKNKEQQNSNTMVGAPSTYTQPMQGKWAHSQGIYRGCGLVEKGKQPISSIQSWPLLGDALLGWHLCPKQVEDNWDHLMHSREISRERSKFLSFQARRKGSRQNQTNWNLLWNGQYKREKVMGMPRCIGGEQLIGQWVALKRCSSQIKMFGEL